MAGRVSECPIEIIHEAKIVETPDNCKHIEAKVVAYDIEFVACAYEYYHNTEYFHRVNGLDLMGKDSSCTDNIEKNMIDWANGEVEKFINCCMARYEGKR